MRHARRLAVRSRGEELTYLEVDARSNGIARAVLDALGARAEPVAVLLGKSPRLIATFLGVLKAGKAVVPLDPSHPAARLVQICASAGAPLLVTERAHRALADSLGLGAAPVLDLDVVALRPTAAAPRVALSPDTLATILYTSGSTGEPKGVAQNHRGTLHNAVNLVNRLRLGPDDRLSLILAAGTVGSIRDIVAALLSGASIHPFDLGAAGFPALAGWIRDERLTYINMVVTLFRHLLAAVPADARFPTVRVVRCGSEHLAASDLAAFRRHFPPDCLFFTGFSATETGTATRLFFRAHAPPMDEHVSAGYAAEDFEVLILDEAGRPCAPGELGEIAIRSPYLALGYWRRPDLTARAFRPDPGGRGARIYLTGDLGRLSPDGCLALVGRRDSQVKIHGASVDPTEIELALQAMPGVRQAAVVVRERTPGDPRLVAYVAPSRVPGPTTAELRHHLQERLPGFMIPAAFVTLTVLPSTPGGKLDRRALPEPDWTGAAPFVAPRTSVEELLAAMWADVLEAETVGIHDGFLELGGDSLQALRLVARIRDRLGLDVRAAALLGAATVAEMAVVVTVAALAERIAADDREGLLGDPGALQA